MLKQISSSIIVILLALNNVNAEVISENNVSKSKRTKSRLYLNATSAYELLKKNAVKTFFIDVRTRGEIAFIGMPSVADANIPFKFTGKKYKWSDKKNNFKMTPNSNFVVDVTKRLQQKGLSKNDKILVMCRSGGRSAKAADALTEAGFTQVFSIIDGFEGDSVKSGDHKGKRTVNGWKNSNLPWSFSLDKNKMYLASKENEKGSKTHNMLKKMDIDKDNMVVQSEFDAVHKKMFGKIDHNNDGILDPQEFKYFKKQHKLEKQKLEKTKHQ
jgi:rhodanese-related sulfurtransferase/sulfur carrier protein ThiS